MTARSPGTVLVLGGGGGRGAAQLGILRALAERNTVVDACVGTSVGALNASAVAGHGLGGAVPLLERIWASPETQAVFRRELVRVAVNRVRRRPWLRSGDRIRELVRSALVLTEMSTFEQLRMPLHIVLTDLISGNPEVISSGHLLDPLCASSAVPGMFPPVRIEGRYYVDGGVVDNCSLATAVALLPRRIIAIDLTAAAPEIQPRRFGEVLDRVLSLAMHARLISDYERFRERVAVTLLCARPRNSAVIGFRDFSSMRDMAFTAAQGVLQRITDADGGLAPGMFYIPLTAEGPAV